MAFVMMIAFVLADSADAPWAPVRAPVIARLPNQMALPAIICRREHGLAMASAVRFVFVLFDTSSPFTFIFIASVVALLAASRPDVFVTAPNSLLATLPQGAPVVQEGNPYDRR